MEAAKRTILHIDLDAFYASVETLYNPSLRGKPVAVVGDQELRHGIVLAKSYEAKCFGVQTGDAIWQAKQKCKELNLVPAHFSEYLKFSRLSKEIFADYSDRCESFGLDENWIDLTGCTHLFAHYDRLLNILRQISPAPIQFKSGIHRDGAYEYAQITIRAGMSQLHTIRTIVNQIAHVWRRGFCPSDEQLEIEAESIAFIVCQYLGLDTSDFSFNHIAKCSFGRERKSLEQFLDAIQKSALYFIDSIDGIQEARRIGYDNSEYFLFVNPKTALRLYWRKLPIYLVFPGEGELLTINRKAIEEHPGPFATDRVLWYGSEQMAA